MSRVGEPVCVEMVPLSHAVLDQLQRLDMTAANIVALEGKCPVLDAPHNIVGCHRCRL